MRSGRIGRGGKGEIEGSRESERFGGRDYIFIGWIMNRYYVVTVPKMPPRRRRIGQGTWFFNTRFTLHASASVLLPLGSACRECALWCTRKIAE